MKYLSILSEKMLIRQTKSKKLNLVLFRFTDSTEPKLPLSQRAYEKEVRRKNTCEARWAIDRVTNPTVYVWLELNICRSGVQEIEQHEPNHSKQLTTPYEFVQIDSTVTVTDKLIILAYSGKQKFLASSMPRAGRFVSIH